MDGVTECGNGEYQGVELLMIPQLGEVKTDRPTGAEVVRIDRPQQIINASLGLRRFEMLGVGRHGRHSDSCFLDATAAIPGCFAAWSAAPAAILILVTQQPLVTPIGLRVLRHGHAEGLLRCAWSCD